MALMEMVVVACDTLSVLGKLLFLSLLGIFSITLDLFKIIFMSALAFFDYLHIAIYFLGLFFCDFGGFIFPFFWNSFLFFLNFSQKIFNEILEFALTIWTTETFVNFRENFIDGICDAGGAVVAVALQNPMFAVKFLLFFVWIFLFLTFRKDLLELFCGFGNVCLIRLISTRNFVVFCFEEALHWTLAPIRAVVCFPTKAKETACSFWRHATSWRRSNASGPSSTDGAAVASKATLRGPSLFRRLQKTDSAESLERLNNHVRELQTKLEEERESKLCIICQSNFRAIVCMPCKHFATCEECMTLLPVNILSRKVCPVCRTQINATIKVYL